MRHDQIAAADSYERVQMTAVWPVSAHLTPPPAPETAAGTLPAYAGLLFGVEIK